MIVGECVRDKILISFFLFWPYWYWNGNDKPDLNSITSSLLAASRGITVFCLWQKHYTHTVKIDSGWHSQYGWRMLLQRGTVESSFHFETKKKSNIYSLAGDKKKSAGWSLMQSSTFWITTQQIAFFSKSCLRYCLLLLHYLSLFIRGGWLFCLQKMKLSSSNWNIWCYLLTSKAVYQYVHDM